MSESTTNSNVMSAAVTVSAVATGAAADAEEIAGQIIPYLEENGIYFAGADLLGGRLSEINITSPTCLQEIHKNSDLDPAKVFWDNLKK